MCAAAASPSAKPWPAAPPARLPANVDEWSNLADEVVTVVSNDEVAVHVHCQTRPPQLPHQQIPIPCCHTTSRPSSLRASPCGCSRCESRSRRWCSDRPSRCPKEWRSVRLCPRVGEAPPATVKTVLCGVTRRRRLLPESATSWPREHVVREAGLRTLGHPCIPSYPRSPRTASKPLRAK